MSHLNKTFQVQNETWTLSLLSENEAEPVKVAGCAEIWSLSAGLWEARTHQPPPSIPPSNPLTPSRRRRGVVFVSETHVVQKSKADGSARTRETVHCKKYLQQQTPLQRVGSKTPPWRTWLWPPPPPCTSTGQIIWWICEDGLFVHSKKPRSGRGGMVYLKVGTMQKQSMNPGFIWLIFLGNELEPLNCQDFFQCSLTGPVEERERERERAGGEEERGRGGWSGRAWQREPHGAAFTCFAPLLARSRLRGGAARRGTFNLKTARVSTRALSSRAVALGRLDRRDRTAAD